MLKKSLRSHNCLGNLAETGGSGDYWHRLERDGPAYLLVLLGGAVAEQIKFGKWGRSGCRSDLQKFHLVVQGLVCDRPGPVGDNDIERPDRVAAGSTIAVERTRYWDQVHEILTRPEVWAWVEAVAEAALERGTLTGDEIDALRPTEGGATVQQRFPPRRWPGAEQKALKAREGLKLKKALHEYERLVGSGSSKKPRTSGAVRQATQIPLAPPKSAPPRRVASPPRPGPRPGP